MQCTIHPAEEGVDACRVCGKPICAGCGEESHGTYVCARCRPAPTATGEPAAADTESAERNPALAALLSFLPGLGQAYNREPRKAVAFPALMALLVHASTQAPEMAIFAGFLWFYQIFDAFYSARPVPPSPVATGPRPPPNAWLLIAAGALLLGVNLFGWLHRGLALLLPVLVILAGLYLLASYFRHPETTGP
jgi:hypothetical protein